MRTIPVRFTFDVVTPRSARSGDTFEAGFCTEDGIPLIYRQANGRERSHEAFGREVEAAGNCITRLTPRELAEAFDYLGLDCDTLSSGGNVDPYDGSETSYQLHLWRDATPAQRRAFNRTISAVHRKRQRRGW